MRKIRKNKKAIAMNVMIMMIIGLVVLGMMIYIANKYILGTSKTAGELSGCANQGGECKPSCTKGAELQLKGLGCTKEDKGEYCCIPTKIGSPTKTGT